ncbi:hypothetical protein PHMEG_0003811 [Phytophthora megakarya]|uniref:HAT C-terminal dimerisation domain-containing protein n=1 Tax=Phytophthora megakarya TaxID=4795 RepID=A0A225WX23_9STRA|nr:hypothetical protein PHMEG_0003811 [Phytophthora megakarya]
MNHFYEKDEAAECMYELSSFLSIYTTGSLAELIGLSEYPLLTAIAVRVFSAPTSSAAAVRAWNIFSYLHTQRRNRMSMTKLETLAFVYINHALLYVKGQD